jgi:hypothetical protein
MTTIPLICSIDFNNNIIYTSDKIVFSINFDEMVYLYNKAINLGEPKARLLYETGYPECIRNQFEQLYNCFQTSDKINWRLVRVK